MLDFPRWKSYLTVVIVFLAMFVVGYDFYNKFNTIGYNGGIKLGLDLRGGSYIVLQADENTLVADYTQKVQENLRAILNNENYSYSNLHIQGRKVLVDIFDVENVPTVVRRLQNFDELLSVSSNKNQISVTITDGTINKQLSEVVTNSIEIVRKRVDSMGTTEPNIRKLGSSQIIVELPGVDNPQQVRRILGTTARLTFHMVDSNATLSGSSLKAGYRYVRGSNDSVIYAIKSIPELYGTDLTSASLQFQNNVPVVQFSLNTEGARKFSRLTTESVGNMLAIVVDNRVISAPYINSPITGGSGIIQGNFTSDEAQELAVLLKAGSLPVPLTVVEERTIGPTLGLESIKSGLIAGTIAYVLVFVFMAICYKKLGMIANVSLLINVLGVLGVLSLLGATLTLPGIAGIILTIGMAVDANILVYERLASTIREAKSSTINLGQAMSDSFNRTFLTIIDANLTTLFTALFLFGFGSGSIRGFAVTLIIGILVSMFCIMYVTKFIINVTLLNRKNKIIKVDQ